MTWKRLALVGLLTLAALVGAPRPAHAQWIDVMKWLSSLDPGPFEGGGIAASVACVGKDARTGQSTWDFHPNCLERATVNPRAYVTVAGALLSGKANLDFGNGIDDTRIKVFHLAGNFGVHAATSLDVGLGAGWAKFGGSNANSRVVHRLTLEPFVIWWPGDLKKTDRKQWWQNFAVRFQYTSFPQGFTAKDFGALSSSSDMNGSEEGLYGFHIIYAFRR